MPVARNDLGFTLAEILVSMALFAVIVLGALGAAGGGGLSDGFLSGAAAARAARDLTAAGVFIQGFQEHAAARRGAALAEGYYCDGPDCYGGRPVADAGFDGHPMPPAEAYQLDWRALEVTLERWYWDDRRGAYCAPNPPDCAGDADHEYLVRVHTKLTWRWRGTDRILEVERFIR